MPESNRGEAFAPNPSAILQDCAAALCRIAAQESVLALSSSLRGLILSFHKSIKVTTV
jgi:hypothetical protein